MKCLHIALVFHYLIYFVSGALIERTWVISYKFVAPDGTEQPLPVVNGQFPGPTLRGNVNDRVRVRVINKLHSETTSIHWHGVQQTGTIWADGTPGITECGIRPGKEYIYEFVLERPGTIWWHSHVGMQKSSLQGLLIVDGDRQQLPSYNDREIYMMLNDYYHKPRIDMMAGLREKLPNKFRWVGDADSILINGRGMYNCTETTKPCDPRHPDAGPKVFDVDQGQIYRIRIANGAALSHLNLGIDGHTLDIVEAEGTLLHPLNVSYMDVGTGTSYSALLRTYTRQELDTLYPGHNGLFWIQANVRHRHNGARGLAILRYSFASKDARPSREIPTDWPDREDTLWSLDQARGLKAKHHTSVPEATRRIVLLGTQNRHEDGSLMWSMNNVSYEETSTPAQLAALYGTHDTKEWVQVTDIPQKFDYNLSLTDAGLSMYARRAPHVVQIAKGEVVDVVLQNTRSLSGAEEVHPWHLHLNDFWVLGYGDHGATWSKEDENNYDLSNAVHRNTVVLYPQSWTAIRFVGNNPGVAFFHCHLSAHVEMGMALAFKVGDPVDYPTVPEDFPSCGLAQRYEVSN